MFTQPTHIIGCSIHAGVLSGSCRRCEMLAERPHDLDDHIIKSIYRDGQQRKFKSLANERLYYQKLLPAVSLAERLVTK